MNQATLDEIEELSGFSKPIWDEDDLEKIVGCSKHGKIGDPSCLECKEILRNKVLGFA